MVLQVQKPGLQFAASATDWRERYGRVVREGTRPLLTLWLFSPIALVYEAMDVYAVTSAAGAAEQLLGLACTLSFLEPLRRW